MAGTLAHVIQLNAPVLQSWLDLHSLEINSLKLLYSIAGNESSFGHNCKPKHEPGFDSGGKYFNRKLFDEYGWEQAHSFSSFQLMFPVAVELGLDGSWNLLSNGWRWDKTLGWKQTYPTNAGDWVACPLVCLYLLERGLKKGAKTTEDLLDCFNSGRAGDANIPHKYIADGMAHYEKDAKTLESNFA